MGSVSVFAAASAVCVAVSCPALVVGTAESLIDVISSCCSASALLVDSVVVVAVDDWAALAEGMCRSANRFFSLFATTSTTSENEALSDFRRFHASFHATR